MQRHHPIRLALLRKLRLTGCHRCRVFFRRPYRTWITGILLGLVGILPLNAQTTNPFQNPNLAPDKRIDNLVSLLTLDEKIGLITDFAVPRLGINSPGNAEAIHQVKLYAQPGQTKKPIQTTSFAQVYGMGETWNPDLIRRAGAVMGYEARYLSQNENYKRNTLVLWGPASDLARDPRWGRNDESFGEDPFLTGTMAVALTKGIQGDDPRYWQAAALLKHVFANSNETTRARSSSNFDVRLMREYYSVPFRMAFTDGGATSYMAAYNAWNGIPMTIHPVLKEVVANEWGANGIVSSDAGAMSHLITQHKYVKTNREAYAAAIKLGMNQFLTFGDSIPTIIKGAMAERKLTENDLNAAIRGKIMTLLKLGALDPAGQVPYAKIGQSGEPEPWHSEKHKAVARQIARESVVLLKNERDFLPRTKTAVKSIAVIGPRAAQVSTDFYGGPMPYAVSVLQGIKDKLGASVTVNYAADNEGQAAVNAARTADLAIVVIGNDPMCGTTNIGEAFNRDGSTKPCPENGDGREGRDRQSLDIPTEDLVKEVYATNPNTIVVLVSSFPYSINWTQAHVPAVLHMTHTAQDQGTAIADVIFGDYNPGGRLTQTWPKSLAQLLPLSQYDIRKGSTYLYSKDEPLYPFGYGLSYTKFDYSDLKLPAETLAKNGTITIQVAVKNTGSREGDEVVQLYVQYPQSKVVRPIKELKGFNRVSLKSGETKVISVPLKAQSLGWWNEKVNRWEVEEGPVTILIGGSSTDIRLQKTMLVK
ncbi:MAG TPA: glycoside hydrolase family 3 C-terminal domain-containing protein [Spirosoma sp.]|nr:glycoside hydrolase family 3 C-terminal domain-containing protein [Spirosoma sp.]